MGEWGDNGEGGVHMVKCMRGVSRKNGYMHKIKLYEWIL